MVFVNYKQTNLAKWQLFAGISASQTSLILKSGYGDLFPTTFPFKLKLEQYDSTSSLENKPVLKREIVKVTNRVGDTFTIERWSESCPANDSATTQTTTQFAFDADDWVFLVQTADDDLDVKTEVERLETDKANDSEVVHNTGDEDIDGVKTFLENPKYAPLPIDDDDLVNKAYVDYTVELEQQQAILASNDYLAWEEISKGDSLFVESDTGIFDIWPEIEDVLSSYASFATWITDDCGVRFTTHDDIVLTEVSKPTSCTATRAILKTSAGVEIATATFSWDIATFTTPITLTDATQYRMEYDNNWSTYTRWYVTGIVDLVKENVTYNVGSVNGSDVGTYIYNVVSMTTYTQADLSIQNIGDVSANTRVAIPVIWSGISANSIDLALAREDALGEDLEVRIETDDNGEPSGELINPNALATIARSSLIDSLTINTISLTSGSTSNAHWVTLDNVESGETFYKWLKFTPTDQVGVVTVDKDSQCTATKAYLYDEDMNLLTTATFSGDTATFNYGLEIAKTYYILAGSDGASYDAVKQTGSASFPYSEAKLDYESGKLLPENVTDNFTRSYTSRTSVIPTEQSISFTVSTNTYIKSCYFGNSGSNFRIYDGAILLETSANGVFTGTTELQTGTTYTIYYSAVWYYSGWSTTFPQVWTYVTYTAMSGWAGSGSITLIESQTEVDEVYNIVDIYTNDNIFITRGQRAWIVLNQVGDDVDPVRYMKVGYSTKHTTTRGSILYDAWWWSQRPTYNMYTISNLFESNLLSKTDAQYIYKLPDIPRLAKFNYGIGELVVYDYEWITDLLDGLTVGSYYYVSDTPWVVSATSWTITYKIWKSIYENRFMFDKDICKFYLPTARSASTTTEVKYIIAPFAWYYDVSCLAELSGNASCSVYKNDVMISWTTYTWSNGYGLNSVWCVNKWIYLWTGDKLSIYLHWTSTWSWVVSKATFKYNSIIEATTVSSIIKD